MHKRTTSLYIHYVQMSNDLKRRRQDKSGIAAKGTKCTKGRENRSAAKERKERKEETENGFRLNEAYVATSCEWTREETL